MDSFIAKANTGAGTDALAGVNTADGFAGAVALVDDSGALHNAANPVPVAIADAVAVTNASLVTLAGAVKAEDSAHVSGDAGFPMFGIRSSTDIVSAAALIAVPVITSEAFATFTITLFEVTVVPMVTAYSYPVPAAAGRVRVRPAAALTTTVVPACFGSRVVDAVTAIGA